MKRSLFSSACGKSAYVVIFFAFVLIVCCSDDDNPTKSKNTNPTASFLVTPAIGTIETIFDFDASGSTDLEDVASALKVRWDYENDGVWDTEYSTIKIATHQYSSIGTITVMLEVMDAGGLTKITTAQISVTAETGTVTDIDGNIYSTVTIGKQRWMSENLRVTHYRNGAAISKIADSTVWASSGLGAYCSFANNEKWILEYGRLYNLFATVDSRGIAPSGWHVPSDAEWQELVDFLGGSSVAGGKLMEAGYHHWAIPNTVATNSSGFTALPGGYRNDSLGAFYGFNTRAYFWSSTAATSSSYWCRALEIAHESISRDACSQRHGFSVRCVKD
jgi:uncharacterized protein (TIGR02145 family)